MNKWLFLHRFFVLLQVFVFINNDITTDNFDPSVDIILFDDICVYTVESNNIIYKRNIDDDSRSNLATFQEDYINKKLIKISEDKFNFFAFNSDNYLSYCEFDKNDNNVNNKELTSSNIKIDANIGTKYVIKYIKESTYLFYYIYDKIFNLYLFNGNTPNGGIKEIQCNDNYELNTVECDSFDGEYIFCVYSTINLVQVETISTYLTITYYSFTKINEEIEKNELKRNIGGPALLKLESNNPEELNKFLICYYEPSTPNSIKNPSVYCQFFTQNGNQLNIGKALSIGTTQYQTLSYENFVYQNPMQLIKFGYSIYIHLKLTQDEFKLISIIFVTTPDLNLIVPYYVENKYPEKLNILLSEKYILFLIRDNSFIKIEKTNLPVQCPTSLYNLKSNIEEISLNEIVSKADLITSKNAYISFDLDPLTYIYTGGNQNMGDLLYQYSLKDNPSIILKYNENLKITYNYYIYHNIDANINNPAQPPAYSIFSQFCLLKVVNCYKSCETCNDNIIGTDELHQCKKCKVGYGQFEFNSDKQNGFINCYKSDDQDVLSYYLNTADNKYYECDHSCLSCYNGDSCKVCNTGFYFKEDELSGICFDTTPLKYYLNTVGGKTVYSRCHDTCKTCFGKGTDLNHKCITCKTEEGYTSYPYDSTKCTWDIKLCKNFWEVDQNNNVKCIDECNDYIIHMGDNKNQCVKDCKKYLNPFNTETGSSLLNYTCQYEDGKPGKYCITEEFCELKRLHYNREKLACQGGNTCVNMSDYSETVKPSDEIDNDEITERTTVVKYFDFKVSFSEIKSFTEVQINIYVSELNKELETHKYKNGISLITINRYEDFKLALYPLYLEDYFHQNVIKTNNLGFINFYETLKGRYTPQNEENLIAGLIEFIDINFPINSINYFFFEYNNDNHFQYEQIEKESLIKGSSFQINIEYPLKNFNNPDIVDSYSSNLLDTLKTLNQIDENANFFDPNSDFYSDICTPFTSEIGTDMTLYDRTETYSIQVSLCENGCQIIDLVDKGEENPRALCQCNFKTNLIKDSNYYSFTYEKREGKEEANINVLKCGMTAFSHKVVGSNFVFWIFIFFIIIFAIVASVIYFCGKNSVEEVLKVKKVVEEEENEKPKNKENIYNMSEKISSVNSEDKYQSIDVKDNRSNSQKGIISSKISYAAPPKKQKDTNSTKENNHIGSGVESINTTINLNNKIELKFKNDEEIFDEIFPDYNDVLNNNIYENKYMKNNYINLRLTNLKLKKYFLAPMENDELIKHNNTDNEDNLDDLNYVKYKSKKSAMFDYYQKLLPKADISKSFLKNHYKRVRFNSDENINNNNNTKNLVLKNSIKFFEDSNFLEDEQINNNSLKKKGKSKLKLKNSDDLIYSSGVSNSLGKYFINSQSSNKFNYTFLKFYWLYLNKREFYLVTVYNSQENLTSFIRLTTFIFVISLQFTLNCLLLTSSQIHERHIYKKEHGSLNEFTYVFQKESGIIFADVFIFLIIKMLFIKFIYEKLFRISQTAKEDLSPFVNEESENVEKDENEENVEKKEVSLKTKKRNSFIKKYNKKSLIYISIIFAVMILLGYISVCYIGTFNNTKGGVVLRFVIAVIFSVIFCAILCLIVVTIYHCLRKTENQLLKLAYNICKIIY